MDDPHLNPDEVARYARHIVLKEIGGAGQQKLKAARVLVLGAGGLGSPVLSYLAAAGVGLLGVIDDDIVSLSNLQRQILHDTAHVGMAKTKSAALALKRLNPHSRVVTHELRLNADNAVNILTSYDMVVDGSDSIETRYLLADTCESLKIPLVTAAVGRFDGSVTVLTPYDTDAKGQLNPRYRDLFPEAPPPGMMPSCAEAGVVGALTGVIGTLEAMEVIKLITGAGDPLIGRLLLYDGFAASFQTVRYRRKS
jgi:molybdopterin/thiamine biosynthesis adenylyltransferase